MADHLTWRCDELGRSAAFADEVQRLAAEAQRERRALGFERFADVTFQRLADALEAHRAIPAEERPYRWSDERSGYVAREYGGEALVRYMSRHERVAGRFLGATAAAPILHELARATAPVYLAPAALSRHPAPIGRVASSAAAHLTGEPFGGRTARVQALKTVTPTDRDVLAYEVRPGDFRFGRGEPES